MGIAIAGVPRERAVAAHQREDGGEIAARAVAADRDAVTVETKLGSALGEPGQRGGRRAPRDRR